MPSPLALSSGLDTWHVATATGDTGSGCHHWYWRVQHCRLNGNAGLTSDFSIAGFSGKQQASGVGSGAAEGAFCAGELLGGCRHPW